MDNGYIEKPTQEERVLKILEDANGCWVDGMTFLRIIPAITQYHARIFGLQHKGHKIEGRFIEGRSWKEYRIVASGQLPI